MKTVFASAAIGAVVGVVVAAVAAASGVALFGGGPGKKMVHATIQLDRVGGDCFITTTPYTLEAYRRETVEWTIVDRCGSTFGEDPAAVVTIAFGNDPTDACTKTGKKWIRCRVKSTADYEPYKYTVTAPNALTEDPVLEIVQ